MARKSTPKIIEISIDQLFPSKVQPRNQFDQEKIAELAGSVATHGILQPVIVRKRERGGFEIIAGERRYRAAKLARCHKIPCIVMELIDEQAFAIALVENVQREDLNPIEEANAYLRLRQSLQLSQEDIAARIGKDRATVANTIRLLRLPLVVQTMVVDGSISMGHARALLSLESVDMMTMVAKKIVRENISVRKVEALIRALKSGFNQAAKTQLISSAKENDAIHREIRLKLERALGTRVELRRQDAGYALVIHFDGPEQLHGLLENLGVDLD